MRDIIGFRRFHDKDDVLARRDRKDAKRRGRERLLIALAKMTKSQ